MDRLSRPASGESVQMRLEFFQNDDRGKWVSWSLLAAVVVTAIGTVMKVLLSNYSLWFDELASVYFSSQPLTKLWSSWMMRESNPPLYYSMLREWISIAGESILSLRMLSIIGGLIGAITLICFAKYFYDSNVALALSIVCALSANQVYFNQFVRGYIFAFDGMTLSMMGVLLITIKRSSRFKIVFGLGLFVFGSVLAMYCHTTAIFWVPSITAAALFVIWSTSDQSRWHRIGLLAFGNLIVVAAAAWWIFITLHQSKADNGNIAWIRPLGRSAIVFMVLEQAFLIKGSGTWSHIGQFAMASLALFGTFKTWSMRQTRIIAISSLSLVLLFIAANVIHPVLTTRTAFLLSLGPTVLAAIGLASIRQPIARVGGYVLVTAALVLNLFIQAPQFPEEDWIAALTIVNNTPGAVLLVEGEPMGIVATEACRVTFSERLCPIKIVATTARLANSDVWAQNADDVPLLPWDRISSEIAGEHPIYTFAHQAYDPAQRMRGLPPRYGVDRLMVHLEGPFASQDFNKVEDGVGAK